MPNTKRFLARLLVLLFVIVFAVCLLAPTYKQGDLFADFTHVIPYSSWIGYRLVLFDIYSI